MKNIFAIIIFISVVFYNPSFASSTNENTDTLKNAIVYQIQFNNGVSVFCYQLVYSVQSSPKHLMTDITKIITNIEISANANNKDFVYLPNSQSSIILSSENLTTLNTYSFKTFDYKGQKVIVKKFTSNSFSYSLPTL